MAEALWRYGRSALATVDDRQFIAGELGEMARRMEANDWKILVEDGSHIAHVGYSWRQSTPIGAISLLSFLAMVADATGDPHWQAVYDEYSNEKSAFRWRKLLDPNGVEQWKPLTLYSNQFSQALLALRRAETHPRRQRQIAELQRRLARRALRANVFDPTFWRRLDWAGSEADAVAAQRLARLGLALAEPRSARALFDLFDPAWMRSRDGVVQSTGNKLCFGIPTAAFHMALTSEDPGMVAEVASSVRRMVQIMLKHGPDYDRGENYNRTVVLGLLLWAAEVGNAGDRPKQDPDPTLIQPGIGPAMDVDFQDGLLYVIGAGRLQVVDMADHGAPVVKGTIGGLGHVRQLCVDRKTAYVTSREDGLYIVDVSAPERMRVLAHYDTIELATGIAVAGDVALVACRTAGVELIDVSSPGRPSHLSTVRTGEAQSVRVRDGILYVGVWGSAELVICDISDPYAPTIIARAKLDGYGDGVDIRGDYCYVATGHHAKSQPHAKPSDPGYGRGHGLEIFNVADPSRPKFVSRVKFPPFYRLGMDMWEVRVTDRFAFVADTYNGVFVVDISEPSEPRVVTHRGLPYIARRDAPSPAAGITVGDGAVFVAGAWSDVYALSWDTSATCRAHDEDLPPTIGRAPAPTADPRFRVYHPPGQVHAVDFDHAVAFVACGIAGLHAIEIAPRIRVLATYPTDGFAFGVATADDQVYVAEGMGGLSIWKHTGGGQLKVLGRYRVPNNSVRQVVAVAHKYLLLHVGPSTLHIVDVGEPSKPTRVLEDCRLGLFYYNPLARGLLAGRYACCHWHVSGLYWYDFAGCTPRWSGERYAFRIGSRNGVAFLGDRALVTCRGGYAFITPTEHDAPEDLGMCRVSGTAFYGKPTVAIDRLFVSDRNTGIVTALDIRDPRKPQLIDQLRLPEHPGLVTLHDGIPIIPAGYQGLLVWDGLSRL